MTDRERQLRDKVYVLDASQLTDGERQWFYSHANDICVWTPADLKIAEAMIEIAAARQKVKAKRKGKK